MFGSDFSYKYCPLLSISPSELTALKELPEKDKDLILPLFPIKSWATAKELSNALDKVEEAVGEGRKWIADIDYDDLLSRSPDKLRQVHMDIMKMINPEGGYSNWCDFVSSNPSIVPCLQLKDLSELETQIRVLNSYQRGLVVVLRRSDLEAPQRLNKILNALVDTADLLVILDLGHITGQQLELQDQIERYLEAIKRILPSAKFAVSSSSFPDSFGGYYKGSISIYERTLYDRLKVNFEDLIYSDRGGARATKLSGGGGTPPPRIDYSCRNDWHFIRVEFDSGPDSDDAELKKTEKKEIYTQIAKEIMGEKYWDENLKLWANYIIQLTAEGDDFGINSAQKATAVRINKHLHTQLHYDSIEEEEDTDEDWVD